jgi:hypothetical protein
MQLKTILGAAATVAALMMVATLATANRQIAKTDGTALSNGGVPSVSSCLSSVTAGVSTSTTALTVALSLTLGGGKIYYVCVGR